MCLSFRPHRLIANTYQTCRPSYSRSYKEACALALEPLIRKPRVTGAAPLADPRLTRTVDKITLDVVGRRCCATSTALRSGRPPCVAHSGTGAQHVCKDSGPGVALAHSGEAVSRLARPNEEQSSCLVLLAWFFMTPASVEAPFLHAFASMMRTTHRSPSGKANPGVFMSSRRGRGEARSETMDTRPFQVVMRSLSE